MGPSCQQSMKEPRGYDGCGDGLVSDDTGLLVSGHWSALPRGG